MKPSKLYSRDFFILDHEESKLEEKYNAAVSSLDLSSLIAYNDIPNAVRQNMSLFPNNLVVLHDLKKTCDLSGINAKFNHIIHQDGALERDVLNFINKTPAYHIVCGILMDRFQFGHHECYLFKEFCLGEKYRADYVLIGKGSGGYEFVLIEFEKPDGRITLKNGHCGEAFRKGIFQVKDWRRWMDSYHQQFFSDLLSVSNRQELPTEFQKYDSTRFHYAVVSGLRSDFDDITYREARESAQNEGIHMIHHDKLLENAMELLNRETF